MDSKELRRKYRKLQDELKLLADPDVVYNKVATPQMIDFTYVYESPDEPSGHKPYPVFHRLDPDGFLLTKAQVTNRVNRRRKKYGGAAPIKEYELAVKYADRKPLDEWDSEELARGRPRNKDGSFSGPKPKWVSMAMHEEAVEKFAKVIKMEMGVATVTAMEQLNEILSNEETDYRGKPLVSASTKLDAAKFLIEHLLGKPKQHIESDVSVKLQGILGSVIVNPNDDLQERDVLNGYSTAHFPGVTMELASMEDANEHGTD